jgi:hypothetical protein
VQRWEHEIIGFSPDVIILLYGHYETIHAYLPWWLERHANSRITPRRKLMDFYRRSILQPIWKFLAQLQAKVDTRLDPNIRRRRPQKVVTDLEKLIGHSQEIGSPLVILFELLPPAKRYQSWFPGMTERIPVMNKAIADLVERIGKPNVRVFPTSEMVVKYADGDIDIATPDGFHYSPHLHRMIGQELAREIAEWADSQPHLQPPAPPARRAARPRRPE